MYQYNLSEGWVIHWVLKVLSLSMVNHSRGFVKLCRKLSQMLFFKFKIATKPEKLLRFQKLKVCINSEAATRSVA